MSSAEEASRWSWWSQSLDQPPQLDQQRPQEENAVEGPIGVPTPARDAEAQQNPPATPPGPPSAAAAPPTPRPPAREGSQPAQESPRHGAHAQPLTASHRELLTLTQYMDWRRSAMPWEDGAGAVGPASNPASLAPAAMTADSAAQTAQPAPATEAPMAPSRRRAREEVPQQPGIEETTPQLQARLGQIRHLLARKRRRLEKLEMAMQIAQLELDVQGVIVRQQSLEEANKRMQLRQRRLRMMLASMRRSG